MRKVEFLVEKTIVRNAYDAAYLSDDENVLYSLQQAVWQHVRMDIDITISGVTMPADAWEDPEHWADEWARELKVKSEDVLSGVLELLDEATVEE
jgi:hypothetical protein